MRPVSHRPARRRRRAYPSQAAAHPRPSGGGRGRRVSGPRSRPAYRGSCRHPVAGLDMRGVQFCTTGRENLCDKARFTGYDIDGGYAEYTVADARFCFPIDPTFSDIEAAPLLCAGLIGYRSLNDQRATANALACMALATSAHLMAQVAKFQGRRVFAITRPGDVAERRVRDPPWRDVGRWHRRTTAGRARRGDHLRARRDARAARAWRGPQGRDRACAPGST